MLCMIIYTGFIWRYSTVRKFYAAECAVFVQQIYNEVRSSGKFLNGNNTKWVLPSTFFFFRIKDDVKNNFKTARRALCQLRFKLYRQRADFISTFVTMVILLLNEISVYWDNYFIICVIFELDIQSVAQNWSYMLLYKPLARVTGRAIIDQRRWKVMRQDLGAEGVEGQTGWVRPLCLPNLNRIAQFDQKLWRGPKFRNLFTWQATPI